MPYGTLGLKEKDQRCHHEVWMHLSHAHAQTQERAPQHHEPRRLHLKKKNFATLQRQETKEASLKEGDYSLVRSAIN